MGITPETLPRRIDAAGVTREARSIAGTGAT
jgi:hypothetical protein